MKTLIIIPAYNESASIERVADNIRNNYSQYDFIVINDGSRDATADICRKNGYPLIDLPVNLGLAGAFQTGMRYAKKMGYDRVVQIDADGQHDPAYLAAMEAEMTASGADIVIGSRFVEREKSMSMRMLGSRMISFAIRLTTGKRLTDPTSGMRLYNRAMIGRFADHINYGPEPDTVSYLLRNGASVSEVQVEMAERMAGKSYLTLSKSVLYMLHMFVSILCLQMFRLKE